jgi:hypothetical protein
MDFRLSVLDVSPVSLGSNGAQALRNTLELARLVDRLGYERYWLAEHHNLPSIASSAPCSLTTPRSRWPRPSEFWKLCILSASTSA